LEIEFDARVVARGQLVADARIGRLADQAVQVVAHLWTEAFRNGTARQLEQQADRANAGREQVLADLDGQRQISDRQVAYARMQRLRRRRGYSNLRACQQGGPFQCRRDADAVGVTQRLQLVL